MFAHWHHHFMDCSGLCLWHSFLRSPQKLSKGLKAYRFIVEESKGTLELNLFEPMQRVLLLCQHFVLLNFEAYLTWDAVFFRWT